MKDKELFVINAIILVIFVSVVSVGIKKEHTAQAYFIEEGKEIQKKKKEIEEFSLMENYKDFILILDDDHTYLLKLKKDQDHEMDDPDDMVEETDDEDSVVEEDLGVDDFNSNNEELTTETDHETGTMNGPSNQGITTSPVQTEVNNNAEDSRVPPEREAEDNVVTETEQTDEPDAINEDEDERDKEKEEIEEEEEIEVEENEKREEEIEKKEKEPLND